MALEAWELIQRHQGNIAGAEIARVLREQYGDIPLNHKTTEAAVAVKRFTDKQKEALHKIGLTAIYPLSGQSLRSLREGGRKFWTDWHKDSPDFENLTSRLSEVAINPNKLFLPKSNNKTLEQQEEMVKKFSEELRGRKRILGIEAVMGEVPDYTELAFLHLDATEERLFGEKYNYDYARTKTGVGSGVALVGRFYADFGLCVDSWRPGSGGGGVWAAPLVVPA